MARRRNLKDERFPRGKPPIRRQPRPRESQSGFGMIPDKIGDLTIKMWQDRVHPRQTESRGVGENLADVVQKTRRKTTMPRATALGIVRQLSSRFDLLQALETPRVGLEPTTCRLTAGRCYH